MATSQVCHTTLFSRLLSSTWTHCVFFRLWPQHYVWAGGHFILLICALRYIFAWAFFKTASLWWYKGSTVLLRCTATESDRDVCLASYIGAAVSYTIVCQ